MINDEVVQNGWVCIADNTLSIVYYSKVAGDWLNINRAHEGVVPRLSVLVPELAEAILSADGNNFPIQCKLMKRTSGSPDVSVVVHRLTGGLNGFYCHEVVESIEESLEHVRSNEDGQPDGGNFRSDLSRLFLIGGMVETFTHDVSNVLTGALGHLAYLKAILPVDGDHAESLRAVEEGTRRVSRMTASIAQVARLDNDFQQNDDGEECIDLVQFTRRLGKMIEVILPPAVELVIETPSPQVFIGEVHSLVSLSLIASVYRFLKSKPRPSKIYLSVRPSGLDLKAGFNELYRESERVKLSLSLQPPESAGITQVFKDSYFSKDQSIGAGERDILSGNNYVVRESGVEHLISDEERLFVELIRGFDFDVEFTGTPNNQFGAVSISFDTIPADSNRELSESAHGRTVNVDMNTNQYGEQLSLVSNDKLTYGVSKSAGIHSAALQTGVVGSSLQGQFINERSICGGTERILVMDDDPSVRHVIVLNLEQLGYDVTAVDSGHAAVEACKITEKPFDLIVLDMVLPDMPGDQVFRHIRSMYPESRVLVMSGFSPAGRVQGMLAAGRCRFVQKPFSVSELANGVRECLEM